MTVHLISLGAGVQSSTLALMAAAGEITPMPTAAIFADTGDEPQSVYDWLNWLETQLPFPIHRVGNAKGALSAEVLTVKTNQKTGKPYYASLIPAFVESKRGASIQPRHCTYQYKIKPILKQARLFGSIKRGQKSVGAVMWLGISRDEAHRMKPSRVAWCEYRWPLIEKAVRREDCLRWMADNGYPTPPRSACRYCPFKSNKEWQHLKTTEPVEFEKAVEFERQLRDMRGQVTTPGQLVRLPFLHRSLKPLNEIDFTDNQIEMGFGNECGGVCGV